MCVPVRTREPELRDQRSGACVRSGVTESAERPLRERRQQPAVEARDAALGVQHAHCGERAEADARLLVVDRRAQPHEGKHVDKHRRAACNPAAGRHAEDAAELRRALAHGEQACRQERCAQQRGHARHPEVLVLEAAVVRQVCRRAVRERLALLLFGALVPLPASALTHVHVRWHRRAGPARAREARRVGPARRAASTMHAITSTPRRPTTRARACGSTRTTAAWRSLCSMAVAFAEHVLHTC
mmetsp:Transcript_47958/g.110284  ORF Transcript_47958/g.110284 Transcript_47958/m.110284 type:complete len:244 (-) Transcript_47958:1236-1967(-)